MIKVKEDGSWIVQVQRSGTRRTRRGTGGDREAKAAEAALLAELENDKSRTEAARVLGIDLSSSPPNVEAKRPPTLRDFFVERWVPHAKVVQNAGTRRTTESRFNYLMHYLGDRRLDELLSPAAINAFVEAMSKNGPLVFATRKDGTPLRRNDTEFSNATINKTLQCLRALLYLAHKEGIVVSPPRVDLLPEDDSTPVLPPTEPQFKTILRIAADFRAVAPFMQEVIEFDAETGLRCGEVFNVAWRSVDLQRGAVRVETQGRTRLVNGRAWKPKHNKWREVPLSKRAREIIETVHDQVPHEPDDLVFPNRGGAPYVRLERAPACAGKGYFREVVERAGFGGAVSFHGLRHLFAVRLLTSGIAITVVSELLGHSDINLTVKRYGRFSSDAKVKWDAVNLVTRR